MSLLAVADFTLYCVMVCRPCHTAWVLLEAKWSSSFGSGSHPARIVLSPLELLKAVSLATSWFFTSFREPRLVVSIDTDCPCGDAWFHTEAYVGCHSVCVFVEMSAFVLKDAPVHALKAATQCVCTLRTPLFHCLDSFELLSVNRDQDDSVVVRFPSGDRGNWGKIERIYTATDIWIVERNQVIEKEIVLLFILLLMSKPRSRLLILWRDKSLMGYFVRDLVNVHNLQPTKSEPH